ncbi:MAG: hypothetical protein HC859_02500 [Bacteroidia bacterium]|nr:hypothetical protein [Bacteroidia bacterium]
MFEHFLFGRRAITIFKHPDFLQGLACFVLVQQQLDGRVCLERLANRIEGDVFFDQETEVHRVVGNFTGGGFLQNIEMLLSETKIAFKV